MLRVGRFDIYWVKVSHVDRRKSLLIYRRRRDGGVSRWEF